MTDLILLIKQTALIREESSKPHTTITLTDDAKKIFKGIKKELKGRSALQNIPGGITKSLLIETFIRLCKTLIMNSKAQEVRE